MMKEKLDAIERSIMDASAALIKMRALDAEINEIVSVIDNNMRLCRIASELRVDPSTAKNILLSGLEMVYSQNLRELERLHGKIK
jgi:molecular chaperone GrpE (heat shock protein)